MVDSGRKAALFFISALLICKGPLFEIDQHKFSIRNGLMCHEKYVDTDVKKKRLDFFRAHQVLETFSAFVF